MAILYNITLVKWRKMWYNYTIFSAKYWLETLNINIQNGEDKDDK